MSSPPLSINTTYGKKWHGGHKVKHGTFRPKLQTPWRKKSQVYYWPCYWWPLLPSTRLFPSKILWLKIFHGNTQHQVNSYDNQEQKMKCILCKKMKCIMWFITIMQGTCSWGNTLHVPMPTYTRLEYMRKYHVLLHLFLTTPYNSMNEGKPHFPLILYAPTRTYYKKAASCPPYTSKSSCKYTFLDNHAHTPTEPHNTPLHPCTNIHTNILLHTNQHKITPKAHNTPLHPHKIIHTVLFTLRPITRISKKMSQHS